MEFVRVSMGARELFPIPLLYYLWFDLCRATLSGEDVEKRSVVSNSYICCTRKESRIKTLIYEILLAYVHLFHDSRN